jgi:hypothetical protein
MNSAATAAAPVRCRGRDRAKPVISRPSPRPAAPALERAHRHPPRHLVVLVAVVLYPSSLAVLHHHQIGAQSLASA